MSAFGRKTGVGGMSGARPSFGVARPMRGPEGAKPANAPAAKGGDQFPPLPSTEPPPPPSSFSSSGSSNDRNADAMTRLADRANGVNDGNYQAEGFEASVHKIKEQVLPRQPATRSLPILGNPQSFRFIHHGHTACVSHSSRRPSEKDEVP